MPPTYNGSQIAPSEVDCPDHSRGCNLLIVAERASGRILASSNWPYPLGSIRAGSRHVYWLDGISAASVCLSLKENALPAAARVPLMTLVGDLRDVTVAGDNLLVMTATGLMMFSPDDAAPRLIKAEPAGWSLCSDGRFVAWVTGTAESEWGDVNRLDLNSGAIEAVATGERRPVAVAIDGEAVFWVTFGSGKDGAVRALWPGASRPETVAAHQSRPRAIALDREAVYWVNDAPDGRHLRRVPRQGGPAEELAYQPAREGTTGEERLVVTESDVYLVVAGQLEHITIDGSQSGPMLRIRPPGYVISFDVDADRIYLTVAIPSASADVIADSLVSTNA